MHNLFSAHVLYVYKHSWCTSRPLDLSDCSESGVTFELEHDKTNKMTCAPSEDSDQPVHPCSLTRVVAVRMMKPKVFGYPWSAQERLQSDWTNTQAGLSYHFVVVFCALTHCIDLQILHWRISFELLSSAILTSSSLVHKKSTKRLTLP